MSLAEKIQSDIVTAMKARDDFRLSVLRMVKAAIQLKEVEKIRKLDDNESIQLLQTILKQRKESIEQFTKGGRPELAEKERSRHHRAVSPGWRLSRRNGCGCHQGHRGNRRGFHQADGRGGEIRKGAARRQDRGRQGPQRPGPRSSLKTRLICRR